MKTVIRRSVFETNSSSTHSAVLKTLGRCEKFRAPEDIPDGEHEIRSDWHKLVFILGILECNAFDNSRYLSYLNESNADDTAQFDEIRADYVFDKKPEDIEPAEKYQAFRSVLINEYCRRNGVSTDECVAKLNALRAETYDDEFLCTNYFYEDVLSDCTCELCEKAFTLGIIDEGLGAFTEENCKKAADILFSPETYLFLDEGWYGGCWTGDKKVF